MAKGEAHQAVHRLARLQRLEVQLALAAPDLLVGVEQDGAIEVLLVAEVVVEQPLVRPGPLGDAVDPRAPEAFLAKLRARGGEDLVLGLLGIALAAGNAIVRGNRRCLAGGRSWAP